MKIAVLVPAHDVAPYIVEALDSVVAQSRPPDAIVVVDDGSEDGTAQVVEDWARSRGQSVQLLYASHEGAAAARNLGLQQIDTDLVALLDADDVFLPHHLASAEKAFERYRDLVLYFSDVEIFDAAGVTQTNFLAAGPLAALPRSKGEEGLLLLGDSVYASLLSGNYMPVSTTVMARSAVEEVGGYDARFINAADRDLNLRLSRKGAFACHPEVSARKRLREDSLSHPQFELRANRYRLGVLKKMLDQADALRLTRDERRATRDALRAQVWDLLYGASESGLPAYLDAWRFTRRSAVSAGIFDFRHLLRACRHSVTRGIPRGR